MAQTDTKEKRKPSLVSQISGVLGEILVTAGLIMGLYVCWQLWFTSWEANAQQANLTDSISSAWQKSPDKIGEARYDDPPSVEHVSELGAPIGVIHIPAFGKEWEYPVLEGTDKVAILDKGAFGHYKETAFPGEVGNFSVAAHRNAYGSIMHYVEDLNSGDAIIVETEKAYYVYKIYDRYVVPPSQGQVIWPVPNDEEASQEPTRRLMTITTCHPYVGMGPLERMITHAEYDHWVAREDGIPEEMANAS